MTDFWAVFWSVVGTALTALVSWLTILLTNFINGKIKDKKMASHATQLLMIVMNAVQCVTQTYVDTLKKQGKFDAKAAEEANGKALAIIMSQMTPDLIKYVEDNFGDLKEYLKTLIESTVYQLKK